MKQNADIEVELQKDIGDVLRRKNLLPPGYRCVVRLHGKSNKKRGTARFEGNWNPRTDSLRIAFSPGEEEERTAKNIEGSAGVASAAAAEDRLLELLRALDRAESRPGYGFVSLKWFRDTALAQEDFSWASDEAARHDAIREAIDRRLVLTSKVPNPRSPDFPVTAIRVNRLMPEVNDALGTHNSAPAFRPVTIRGEPLSATVLHDRR